jgi:hypothetical protein
MRNVYTILVGIPARKRPLGRCRRRWEDNTDVKEKGCKDEGWSHLAQEGVQWRVLLNMEMTLRVP